MTVEKIIKPQQSGLKRQNEEQYLNDILKPKPCQSTDDCFKDILDAEMTK